MTARQGFPRVVIAEQRGMTLEQSDAGRIVGIGALGDYLCLLLCPEPKAEGSRSGYRIRACLIGRG